MAISSYLQNQNTWYKSLLFQSFFQSMHLRLKHLSNHSIQTKCIGLVWHSKASMENNNDKWYWTCFNLYKNKQTNLKSNQSQCQDIHLIHSTLFHDPPHTFQLLKGKRKRHYFKTQLAPNFLLACGPLVQVKTNRNLNLHVNGSSKQGCKGLEWLQGWLNLPHSQSTEFLTKEKKVFILSTRVRHITCKSSIA